MQKKNRAASLTAVLWSFPIPNSGSFMAHFWVKPSLSSRFLPVVFFGVQTPMPFPVSVIRNIFEIMILSKILVLFFFFEAEQNTCWEGTSQWFLAKFRKAPCKNQVMSKQGSRFRDTRSQACEADFNLLK